jgi:hypothetical protein
MSCVVVGGGSSSGGMLELALAMNRGQVPSGEVLAELLEHAKEALEVQKHNTEWLNREGRMLASDLATLLWAGTRTVAGGVCETLSRALSKECRRIGVRVTDDARLRQASARSGC